MKQLAAKEIADAASDQFSFMSLSGCFESVSVFGIFSFRISKALNAVLSCKHTQFQKQRWGSPAVRLILSGSFRATSLDGKAVSWFCVDSVVAQHVCFWDAGF